MIEVSVVSTGLGDHLRTFSMLCNIPDNVIVHIPDTSTFESFLQLQTLFCISSKKLKIVNTPGPNTISGGWYLGVVSNYYYPKLLNLNHRIIDLPRERKRRFTIGLACYGGTDCHINQDGQFIRNHYLGNINEGKANKSTTPVCKYRSLDYYSKLFYYLRTIGYDVITLDHPSNIESKVDQLVNNCAAVIGYEGGVAHLCNMLEVPYIMLDWADQTNAQYGSFQCEMTHQSRTMHILRDDKELFNKTESEFNTLIDRLENKQSNNRFLTGEYSYTYNADVKNIKVFNDQQTFEYGNPFISETAIDLTNKYKLR